MDSCRPSPRIASRGKFSGFTLIELLIVVAIIAILAAIAVPNFLEAQVRAKVARSKADMRSMATAIESYRVDNNRFNRTFRPAAMTRTNVNAQFTTPIAYITNVFPDPFNTFDANQLDRVIVFWASNDSPNADAWGPAPSGQLNILTGVAPVAFSPFPGFFDTTTNSYRNNGTWISFTAGPDQKFAITTPVYPSPMLDYDPTNGTVSPGDIIRFAS